MELNGTIKKTQALSGRLVRSSGGGGSVQEIYWVQYGVGTATNAEVNEAVAANKLPICYWDRTNAYSQTTRELYYLIQHTATEALFAKVDNINETILVRRLYADAWNTQTIRYQGRLTWDQTPRFGSVNPVTSGGIYNAIQNATVSDERIAEAVDDWLTAQAPSIGTLSYAAKQALLTCLRHVAWIDDQGQSYYNALESELFPDATLESITAVFTQGQNVIYDTDSLDTLEQYLVVTANYSGGVTETVTDYILSGDLEYEGGIVDLLDGVSWTDGIAYDDNGSQLDRPTLACSDFISVTPGTVYTYSKPSADTDGYGMGLYLYDANRAWVGRETSAGTLSGAEYIKTYTPPSNVAYVRLMSYVTEKSVAEFTYDDTPSTWTSIVTVSYGGKSTTFNVSVTRSNNLLFHVENRVFDGTAGDGVATGINIQESDSSFTILAILTTNETMSGTGTKFMLFASRASTPNIQFTEYSSNASHCNFRYMTQYSDNAFDMRSAGVYKVAVVHTAGSNSATCYMKANNGSVLTRTVSSSPFTTDPDAEFYFGCRGDSYWYLKGTLTLGEIYSKAFSSGEIDAFMNGG